MVTTPLDELRQEIDRRLTTSESQVEVLVAVIESLLRSSSDAASSCSYSRYFQVYRRFRSRLTALLRLSSYDYASPVSEIAMRIGNINKALAEIRDVRYQDVCRGCSACRTRRKQWPQHTIFMMPQRALLCE
jgi:hypothetical protein